MAQHRVVWRLSKVCCWHPASVAAISWERRSWTQEMEVGTVEREAHGPRQAFATTGPVARA